MPRPFIAGMCTECGRRRVRSTVVPVNSVDRARLVPLGSAVLGEAVL